MRYLAMLSMLVACGGDKTDGETDADGDTDTDTDSDSDSDTDTDTDSDTDTDTDTDPDVDGDGFPASTDCDDGDVAIHPGVTEVCDRLDQNCDGNADEGVLTTFFEDADGDGFGDDLVSLAACAAPTGYVGTGGDCDDSASDSFPGGVEVCDGADQDCNGAPDDSLSFQNYYVDDDGDGFGTAVGPISACAQPPGTSIDDRDCDDTAATTYPGAPELCDGTDQNCDTVADNGLVFTDWFVDGDGDGYGDPFVAAVTACEAPVGTVSDASDCDDDDDAVNPGAVEVCDGADQNCSGAADEGLPLTTWHRDNDGDGFGSASSSPSCLTTRYGYAVDGTDCNDGRPEVYPGAHEIGCNGVDDDCSGGDAPGDLDVPADHATIQAAITAALPGDSICIAPGTYTGLVTVNKDLDLVGTGPGVTLSTGNGARLFVAGAGHARLVNVTLDGRNVEPLIQVSGAAQLDLNDVTAKNLGCGAFCYGLVSYQYSGSELTVRRFRLAEDDGVVGPATDGLGLFYNNASPLTIEDSYLGNLTVGATGGDFLVSSATNVYLRNLFLDAFVATPSTPFNLLGTVAGTLEGVTVRLAEISGASTVGIVDLIAPSTVLRAQLLDNELASTTGEVFGLRSYSALGVESSLFSGNDLQTAGAAAVVSAQGSSGIVNDTFAENTGLASPFVVLEAPGPGVVNNVVLANDVADAELRAGSATTITYTDIFGPSTPLFDSTGAAVPWTGMVEDPLFYPYSQQPQPASPLIDAGDPAILDLRGGRSDVGAFGGPRALIPAG
jgi:hypothetical protein